MVRNPEQSTRFDPARRSPTAKRAIQAAKGDQATEAAAALLSGDRLQDLRHQRGGFTGGIEADPASGENDGEYASLRPALAFKAPIRDDPVQDILRPEVIGIMSDQSAARGDGRQQGAPGGDVEAGAVLAEDGLYVGRQPSLGARNTAKMTTRLALEDEAWEEPAGPHGKGSASATQWLTRGTLVTEPIPLKERSERPTHFPSDSDVLFQVVLTKPVVSATSHGMYVDSRPSFYTLNVDIDDVVFLDHPLFIQEEVLAQSLELMYDRYTSLASRDLITYWTRRMHALQDALAAAAASHQEGGSSTLKGLALDDSLDASMIARRSFHGAASLKEMATRGASAGKGRHAKLGPVSLSRSQSYVLKVDQAEMEALHAQDQMYHIRKLQHDIREARRNLDLVEFDIHSVVYDMVQAWSLLKSQRTLQGFAATHHKLAFHATPTDAEAERDARALEIDARVSDARDEAQAVHDDAVADYEEALAEYEAVAAALTVDADADSDDVDSDDASADPANGAGVGSAAGAGPSSSAAPAPAPASLPALPSPPTPPQPFAFDENAVREEITRHLERTKRAPGQPILVPILTMDGEISSGTETSAAEASRRSDLAKIGCHVKLVANDSNVTETSNSKLQWPNMRLGYNQGFALQLFSWPSLRLELYSSGLFKSMIASTPLQIPGEASATQVGENADFASYYLLAPSTMRASGPSIPDEVTSLLYRYLPPSAKIGLPGGQTQAGARRTMARVRVRLSWGSLPNSDGLAAAPRKPPGTGRTLIPTSMEGLHAWAREHDMDPEEPANAAVFEALAGGTLALATPAAVERLKAWVKTVDLDPNDPRNLDILHLLSSVGSHDDETDPAPSSSTGRGVNVFGSRTSRGPVGNGPRFRTQISSSPLGFPAALLPSNRRLELLSLRWKRPINFSGPVPLDEAAIREAWFGEASDTHHAVVVQDQYVARVREMTASSAARRGHDTQVLLDYEEVISERPPPTFGLAFAGILEWFQPRRKFKPVRETRVAKTVAVHRAELVIKVVRGYSIPNREGQVGAGSGLEQSSSARAGGLGTSGTDFLNRSLTGGAAAGSSSIGNNPGPSSGTAPGITLPGDKSNDAATTVEPVVQIRFQDGIEWTHRASGPNPVWNDTIVFEIEPPEGSFKPEVLATMQDLVYFNIFDSKVAPFESFMDEEELKYKIPRRNVWLGTFGLPFSTIYSNSLLQGRFHVNVPLISPGYVREQASSAVAVEHISPYAPTMLELYITTRPALEPPRAVAEKTSSRETPEFLAYARKWEKAVRAMSAFGKRNLEVLVADQSRTSVFVCRYIRPVAPPADLTTARQILRYVSLLPFLSDSAAFAGRRHVWNTMDEFFEYGVGDEEEHALLLANYFLYSDLRAYVVLGRGIPEGETAYVMTIGDAGQVHFWNAHAGKVYSANDPDIPLRSIGMVFNADNLWANVQGEDAPWVMSFNVHNTAAWKPFFTRSFSPSVSSIQPESIIYAPVDRDAVEDITRKVRNAIKSKLEEWRLAENLPIRFNSQATLALSDLLVRFERHYQGVETLSLDSHRIELARLLTTYNISGFPLQMPFTHVDPLIEAVRNTGVHLDRHPRGQLALAVQVFPYPNVHAVWVYVASLTPHDL